MQNSQYAIADSSTKSEQEETNKSLDNTSHPGTPEPDELVPSRYALRIGNIDVLVVSDGCAIAAKRDVGTQRRPGRPGGLAEGDVRAAGNARLAAERGRGA